MKMLMSAWDWMPITSFDSSSAFEEVRPENLRWNEQRLRPQGNDTYHELTRSTTDGSDGWFVTSGGGKTSSFSIPGTLAMRGYRVNPSKLVSVTSLPTSFALGLSQPSFPTLSIVKTSRPRPGRISSWNTPGLALNCRYPRLATTCVSAITAEVLVVSCNCNPRGGVDVSVSLA